MEKRGKRGQFYCIMGIKYDIRKKGGEGKNINYFDNIHRTPLVYFSEKNVNYWLVEKKI